MLCDGGGMGVRGGAILGVWEIPHRGAWAFREGEVCGEREFSGGRAPEALVR